MRLRALSDSHADAVVLSGALESDVAADERLTRTGVLVRRRLEEDYEIVREIRRGVVRCRSPFSPACLPSHRHFRRLWPSSRAMAVCAS